MVVLNTAGIPDTRKAIDRSTVGNPVEGGKLGDLGQPWKLTILA